MIRSKRWAGALLVLLVACLYFPLNRLLTSGYNLQTALDAYIPIVPLFVVPYLLCLPYWLLALGVAAWKMDDALYRASIFGALAAIGTATLIYAAFPTYTDRPLIGADGWAARLLAQVYSNDQAFNAFPSGHVLFTTLISLFAARWKPGLRWGMAAITAVVVLATLFTGQHHLVDPLGGLALGWAGYRFGLWAVGYAPAHSPALGLQRT